MTVSQTSDKVAHPSVAVPDAIINIAVYAYATGAQAVTEEGYSVAP
jgi:hypothetical protein